ncbi:Di-glucose binding within endoplasmic reticulum [Musa troglodytarum]|uniref:non-specific serine/threonine protein kinase n=1 Tax=Musa troglodytarum TaxID=320322 RepID=A0A9E7IAZ8_9LILI|nr:Di-glucose binding within endoplasmic reticulum [Musa troglodytarum]
MVPQIRFFIFLSTFFFFLFAFVFSIISSGGGGPPNTNAIEKEALRNIQKQWRITTWETLQSTDPATALNRGGETVRMPGSTAAATQTTTAASSNCECISSPWVLLSVIELLGTIIACLMTFSGDCRKVFEMNVSGRIPDALFNLTNLVNLNLSRNILNGSIPEDIHKLKHLRILSLDKNQFSGNITPSIGNLTNLTYLSLGTNRFSGGIPSTVGSLTLLEQLYIDSSGLSGPLPSDLANMTSLKKLWAFDNDFTGNLPESIGQLTNLTDLQIYGTSLEGPIPKNFSALTKLETLKLGDLSGADSNLLFLENMKSLFTLSLRNCQVADEIPTFLRNFSNLTYLFLGNNALSDLFPSEVLTENKNLTTVNYIGTSMNRQSDRISTRSLRYHVVGLQNGTYKVELLFAEIVMDDTPSWTGLGRRIFNIYIQNQLVEQDFNIIAEAKGSKKPYNKTYKITVANNILDIHLLWSGRGTCCIPAKEQDHFTPSPTSSSHNERRAGIIVGIAAGCAAAVKILSSIVYLWWKRIDLDRIQVHTNTAKQTETSPHVQLQHSDLPSSSQLSPAVADTARLDPAS